MDYKEAQKLGGKEVECSNDGENWFTGTLKGVKMTRCDLDMWRAGMVYLHDPVTTYKVDVEGMGEQTFKEIRVVREYKEGDVVTMGELGVEATVTGYTEGGKLKFVDRFGREGVCKQSAVKKVEKNLAYGVFGGFDCPYDRVFGVNLPSLIASEAIEAGKLVCIDTDSVFVQEYCAEPVEEECEKVVETHSSPAIEIGMPVTCPPCEEDSVPIGTVIGFGADESDVRVQLWNTRDVFEFDENAIVPYIVKMFKKGDMVRHKDGEALLGEVVEYDGNGHVVIRCHGGFLHLYETYTEDALRLYREPEECKIEVEASKDMSPEEKLEKVKEFAKALDVDVNEIVGRKGCVGLVVRK